MPKRSDEDSLHDLAMLRSLIEAEILSNTDSREKEVGDRVILWDGSSIVDQLGKKHLAIDDNIDGKVFIVVEKSVFPGFWEPLINKMYENDLKVVSVEDPSLILYTHSSRVQLEDFVTMEKKVKEILK